VKNIYRLAAFFTLFSAFATISLGQTADTILSQLSEKAKNYGTINASYTSTLTDLKNDFSEEVSGTILIDNDKFNLDLGDYVIVSDGVTVWTYDTSANECYIDDVEILIEEGMDPSKIFTIWEDDFKSEQKGAVELEGVACTQINLYPIGADEKPYHTIQLFVDEAKMEIIKVLVKGREGNDTEYIITSFETGVSVPDGSFKFEESKYPGVEVIDNRI
jgi:outer membrane lipoprotein-sorting protein